jgi:hypothetical protein
MNEVGGGSAVGQQTRLTATPDVPELAVARTFLDGLVAQDFTAVGDALAPHVRLRALLPAGLWEWTGADVVTGRFERWFGDTEHFDPVEATVGEVGGRARLRWRFRLQARRLGTGCFVVEQSAYAELENGAGIAHLDLLCTGYLLEASDG